MGNEIAVFQNPEFGEIRTVTVDGEAWFVGKDVAERLGYSNTRKALIDHVDAEDKGVTKRDTPGGTQEMTIINESGLYSLILSSKLPSARAFKRWVTSEVIPAIRKTGAYRTANNTDNLFRCAEIMASCLPENKPQVMKILDLIIPELNGQPTKAVSPAAFAPKVSPAAASPQVPAVRRFTRCDEKFDFEELEQLMCNRGLTDWKLEKLIGCSDGMVSRWRHGYSNPSVEYRQRLCAALQVPDGHFDLRCRRKRP